VRVARNVGVGCGVVVWVGSGEADGIGIAVAAAIPPLQARIIIAANRRKFTFLYL
jgi:hypothetical protein